MLLFEEVANERSFCSFKKSSGNINLPMFVYVLKEKEFAMFASPKIKGRRRCERRRRAKQQNLLQPICNTW
jgi:hypothetical protein